MNQFQQMWNQSPLRMVLIIGLLVRLVAVFCSPGYLFHDDHFLVIEPASSWVVGEDHNRWLPQNMKEGDEAHAVNFAYVGTQYILLKALNTVGVMNPKTQMLVLRFIHALYSLLIILFGFKIVERLSGNKKLAARTGLILALLAFMPNFAVRSLVEMVCIPPLMWAVYILVKHRESYQSKHFILAGIGIGLATALRYQCGVFGIGIGLALIGNKEFKGAVITGVASLFFFSVGQLQDLLIWGEPFKQLRTYIEYNSTHSGSYPNGPWYRYILTTLGFLLPPVSVLLIIGFFREWKKHLIIFLPTLLFIVFHSFYPNKQERFILPSLPFIIVLGMYGWHQLASAKNWLVTRRRLLNFCWGFFWVVNTLVLAVFSTAYTKRCRVESMYHFYESQDLVNFIAVAAYKEVMPPQHYSGNWCHYINFHTDKIKAKNRYMTMNDVSYIIDRRPEDEKPNYIIFYGKEHIPKKVEQVKKEFPNIQFVKAYEPGFLDRFLHMLNPKNALEEAHIYSLPASDIKPWVKE